MSIIKIINFGGELPRVSARALPADAAQINTNLLATSTEFRPLLGDLVVSAAILGGQTLQRMARTAEGVLRTDDTSGWVTDLGYKSYVKGQINDDATERTYVSFNDGSAPPRSIDALGRDRLLGVPAPTSLTATVNVAPRFTRANGQAWQTQILIPNVTSAVLETLINNPSDSRMHSGGIPVAGPYTVQGLTWVMGSDTDYWNLRYTLPLSSAMAAGLVDPLITPETSGSNLVIRISCLPYWAYIADAEPLKVKLRGVRNPVKPDVQLMDEELVTHLSDEMVKRFDPAGASIRAARTQLESTIAEFVRTLSFGLTPAVAVTAAPVSPSSPEYYLTGGDSGSYVRNPEWAAYDAVMATYNIARANASQAGAQINNEKSARINRIAELQATALRLTQQLEAESAQRRSMLTEAIKAFADSRNFSFDDNAPDVISRVVPIDVDPILEARFYLATYTTDWGEESAPSVISPLLSVDQSSSVTVTIPVPPEGYGINKWTIYRTATGSVNSAFLFVSQDVFTAADMARGLTDYLDTKKGAELGEMCPTLTWRQPPFRINSVASTVTSLVLKGPNPYLRGLVGMPNGIMAGFIDNFVAFCDPYHPYAWPVEYQIPLDALVTGLGVFGQTLFVGTTGNPYLISGADSASMSAQRLDDEQACVSARSVVAARGGVLYASPDGICLATSNGVEVITGTLFAREDWQALNPSSIFAKLHDGVYYFWYTGRGGGCYALDTVAKKLGQVDLPATAAFSDAATDGLFVVVGNQVKRLFASQRRTGTWKSPRIELDAPSAMAWGQVMGSQSLETPATLTWRGDGIVRYIVDITDTRAFRLPSGEFQQHEIEISSAARLTKIFLASSTAELKGAS